MVLFMVPTGVGQTHLALVLLEKQYFNHFHFIIILCPPLRYNEAYLWIDSYVIPIEPGNHFYDWIKMLGSLLAGFKNLFFIDDIIANGTLDKRRQPLPGLAISGRHKDNSLWMLTQSYTTVSMNIRRQAKMLYVWYLKKRGDWDTIHEESDIIEMPEEVASAKKQLKWGKHTCLVMRTERPRAYEIAL